ncbi:arabinosyltransferase ARAD1 [Spatholobus suberectus]|nr:arabinosyltransferase ARAD1 [Spatholobus suberectus]
MPRSKQRMTLFLLLLGFSLLLFLFSLSPLRAPSSPTHHLRIPNAETSFVASLDHFLAGTPTLPDDTVHDQQQQDTAKLDDAVYRSDTDRLYSDPYYPVSLPLRVYVYDMPPKFTYDLLWLFKNTYRDTSNLTSNGSPVHRLVEQHSVDYWLWADLIAPRSERLLSSVVREALKWITDQPAWKRSGGRDHILPVHHPWSFKSVRRYVKNAIWLLPDMDSTGNWYKPGQVFLEKDLILPYVPNVELCDAKCLSETNQKRSTLLFFRGRLKRNAGGKIRSKLVAELSGADGVIIEEGTAGEGGKEAAQSGMRKSLFCLSPAGDTPSSARLFDAIVSGCIPVIISDELELPFEGILDYRKIALFISSKDAVKPGWLLKYLKGIRPAHIKEMQQNLAKYSRHFLYSSPAQSLGPEDLVWKMMAGKVVNIKLHTRRSQRVVEGSRSRCTCECGLTNITNTASIIS